MFYQDGKLLFEKSLDELVYQVSNDELPGKLWALRQLARQWSGFPATIETIGSILNGPSNWWLKAEAAMQLRNIQSNVAETTATTTKMRFMIVYSFD